MLKILIIQKPNRLWLLGAAINKQLIPSERLHPPHLLLQ